jgi:hypothetical protein
MLTKTQQEVLREHAQRYIRYHRYLPEHNEHVENASRALSRIESMKSKKFSAWSNPERVEQELYWDLHELFPIFYYTAIRNMRIKTLGDILKATEKPPTNTIDFTLDWYDCSELDWEEYSSEEIINVASRVRSPQIRSFSIFTPANNFVPTSLGDFLARVECRRIKLEFYYNSYGVNSYSYAPEELKECEALVAVLRNSSIEVFIYLICLLSQRLGPGTRFC